MRPAERPYTAADVAEKLGHGVDWFYANYTRLIGAPDFMPERLASHGHYRFNRMVMDAWLGARTRRLILSDAAANDAFPLAPSIEQEREVLAREYGARP